MGDGRLLAAFFGISFGVTWGIAAAFLAAPEFFTRQFGPLDQTNLFFIIAVYAPAMAGLFLVWLNFGAAGLGRYLSRLGRVRAPWPWYAWLVLGIPLLMLAGAAWKGTLSPPVGAGLLGAIVIAAVLGPVEELGWRGLALPLLQRHLSPAAAGLVLGLVWGAWHLPAFFIGGTPQSGWSFLPFFVGVVAASVIMTGLYNASRGSLLLAMLMHFQLNNPLWPDAQPYDSALLTLVALLAWMVGRRGSFARERAVTSLVG
ncbi:MAG: CPBP family intramembrane glutamic endopeptidase [Pseudomonadales bacterium]